MKAQGAFATAVSVTVVLALLLAGCGCPTTTPAPTVTTSEEEVEVFTPSASAIFGETFAQEKGGTATYDRTFSSEPVEGTIYVLYADTGAVQPDSIASVMLNGQNIAELDDFGQQLKIAILPVVLREANNLQIGLTLSPEGVASVAVLPLDTVPPPAPVIPVTRYSTSGAGQVIAGTAEANSMVTVDGGAFLTQQELGNGDTAFSIPVPLRWNEVNTLLVTATDAAGNVSPSIEVSVEQTGETGTASLAGKVIDAETERGIQGAEVKVAGTFSSRTDADGSYTVPNLPEGSTTVSVSAPGFVGNVQRVSLEAGQTILKDIALAGEAPATVIGPGGGTVHGTDGTTLEIPPGALDRETSLTVSPIHTLALPAAPGIGTKFLGMTDLGPSGTRFNVPVTFTFPLIASLPADTEFDVISFNPDTGAFRYVKARVNADGTTASIQLDRIEGGGFSFGLLKFWGKKEKYTYTEATSIEGGRCEAEKELIGEAKFNPEFVAKTIPIPGVAMTAVTLINVVGYIAPDQTRPISATVPQGYTGKLYAEMTIEEFKAGASLNLFFFTIELGSVKGKGMIKAEGVVKDETELRCLTGTWTINSWGSHRPGPEGADSSGQFGREFKIAVKQEKNTLTGKGTNLSMGQLANLTGKVKDGSKVTFTIHEHFPIGNSGYYADLPLNFSGTVSGTEITGTFHGGFDDFGIDFRANGQFEASVGYESEVIPSPTQGPIDKPADWTGTISVGVSCRISHATWGFEGPLSTAYIGNPENAVVTISGPTGERSQKVDEQGGVHFYLPAGNYKVTASARWYTSQTEEVELSPLYIGGRSVTFSLSRETGTILGRVLCGGRGVGVSSATRLDVSFTPTGERTPYQLWVADNVSFFDPTDTEYASYRVSSAGDGSYSQEVDAGHYFIFVRYAHMFSYDSYNETTPSLWVEPEVTVPHDIILVPFMWVDDIIVSTETRLETRTVDEQVIETTYIRAKAIVTVRDWLGPLSGVEVNGRWSADYSGSVSGTTDGEGRVTFTTDWVERGDFFEFTVDGLEKTDWEYDEEGSETSSSGW